MDEPLPSQGHTFARKPLYIVLPVLRDGSNRNSDVILPSYALWQLPNVTRRCKLQTFLSLFRSLPTLLLAGSALRV